MSASKHDPYKVLQLRREDATYESLRKNFKRLAIKTHPDKGGSNDMFEFVTECYKEVLCDIKRKDSDKLSHTLREEYKKYVNCQAPPPPPPPPRTKPSQSKDFSDKFNRLFNDTRMSTALDDGYGNMMQSSEPDPRARRADLDPPQNRRLAGSKFNNNTFNSEFDKTVLSSTTAISKHSEPEAMCLSRGIPCSDIVSQKISDFSGNNDSCRAIHYTDYKLAHETTRLADPALIAKVRNNSDRVASLDKYAAMRKNATFDPTEEEDRYYATKARDTEATETQRAQAMMEMDRRISEQYTQVTRAAIAPSGKQ
jgi:hypothetical protein